MLRQSLAALRLILAALVVYVGLIAAAGLAHAAGLEGSLALVVLVPAWLAVVVGAFRLFNHPEDRRILGHADPDPDPDAEVERLRALGSLVEREFHVRRVFEVEDNGYGSQYVCELDEGTCLLLRGQYLWDHVHPWSWPWRPKRTRFPCTRFVLYQRPSGGVVHLVCGGEELAPEGVASPFTIDEFLEQELFEGEVRLLAQPYEQLKRLLFGERPIRAPED